MVANDRSSIANGQKTRLHWLVWIFTISFILHNLEELLRMESFLAQHMDKFPVFFQKMAGAWQPSSFAIAIWMLNGLTILFAWISTSNGTKVWVKQGLTIFAALLVCNALSHVLQSIYLGILVPGIFTAILLILPISLILLRTAHQNQWLSRRQWICLLLTSFPLMLLLIFGIMAFSSWIGSL
jgi:hypothetical protein